MKINKISTKKAPAAIGPYSQAVVADRKVYTSGQIPIDPLTGDIVPGGIEEQTKQVMKNLEEVLTAAGSGLEKVVKTTVFIENMNDFSIINKTYGEYFSEPYPARSCIEVSKLPKDVLIEIEVIAVIDD